MMKLYRNSILSEPSYRLVYDNFFLVNIVSLAASASAMSIFVTEPNSFIVFNTALALIVRESEANLSEMDLSDSFYLRCFFQYYFFCYAQIP